MTITTAETLTANGVVLNTLAYNVSTLTGRLRTPARRGGNVEVPARHGALRVPGKKFAQAEVVLPMWVVGADEDGLVPASGPARARLFVNVDKLTRVFGAELVELVHTLPDGSQRRVLGEVTEVIDFTSMAAGSRAEFAVTVTVPDGFWSDVAAVTASLSGTGDWSPAAFAAATAPMDDLLVTFTGPSNNPLIQSGAVWVRYGAVLSAGQSVTLDCGAWSLSGGGGLVPSHGAVSHGGDARWFVLLPSAGPPLMTVSQTGTGAMSTTLSGKRKYLVG